MHVRRELSTTAWRLSVAAAAVLALAACGGSPTGPSTPSVQPTPDPQPNVTTTIRAAAESRGLLYGCAVRASHLAQDPAFAQLVASECGMVVPENELKWEALRPSASSFSFDAADRVAAFAQQNGLRLRGHTLVWHAALPAWFAGHATAQNAGALLDEHVAAVVGRYAGRMHSWDVVNEAVETNDGRADGLRETIWLRLLGPDYIDRAFNAAAKADPAAMLVYNENGLEYTWSAPKRQAVLALLRGMRARGVPVHALGIQAHIQTRHTLDLDGLRSFMADVEALGLKVLVTEMDVADETLPADATARDQAVADLYKRFMTVALGTRGTVAVLTWGISDRYSWLQNARPRSDGLPVRGLPFDQSLGQKAAYQAMASSMAAAPSR